MLFPFQMDTVVLTEGFYLTPDVCFQEETLFSGRTESRSDSPWRSDFSPLSFLQFCVYSAWDDAAVVSEPGQLHNPPNWTQTIPQWQLPSNKEVSFRSQENYPTFITHGSKKKYGPALQIWATKIGEKILSISQK